MEVWRDIVETFVKERRESGIGELGRMLSLLEKEWEKDWSEPFHKARNILKTHVVEHASELGKNEGIAANNASTNESETSARIQNKIPDQIQLAWESIVKIWKTVATSKDNSQQLSPSEIADKWMAKYSHLKKETTEYFDKLEVWCHEFKTTRLINSDKVLSGGDKDKFKKADKVLEE